METEKQAKNLSRQVVGRNRERSLSARFTAKKNWAKQLLEGAATEKQQDASGRITDGAGTAREKIQMN